jgi:hypothetical protein
MSCWKPPVHELSVAQARVDPEGGKTGTDHVCIQTERLAQVLDSCAAAQLDLANTPANCRFDVGGETVIPQREIAAVIGVSVDLFFGKARVLQKHSTLPPLFQTPYHCVHTA